MKTVYRLNRNVEGIRPAYWHTHIRYAMLVNEKRTVLPKGMYVLDLGPGSAELHDGTHTEHLYRTVDGKVFAINPPLQGEYRSTAMNQVDLYLAKSLNAWRSLDDLLIEEHNLSMEIVDRSRPFALISCPYCGGKNFVTMELSETNCANCWATFTVRPTAGDPGFVVDCRMPPRGSHKKVNYIVPESDTFHTMLIYKHCEDEEYNKRWLFYGKIPSHYPQHDRGGARIKDSYGWPSPATITCHNISPEQYRILMYVESFLRSKSQSIYSSEILRIARAPRVAPCLIPHSFPSLSHLNPNEKFLLYSYATCKGSDMITATPIWRTVVPIEHEYHQYEMTDRVFCISCNREVLPEHMDFEDQSKHDIPHGWCRDTWDRYHWRPIFTSNEEE